MTTPSRPATACSGIRSLEQLRHLHYDPATGKARHQPIPEFVAGGAASETVERLVAEALQARQQMRSIDTVAPPTSNTNKSSTNEAKHALEALTAIADTLTAAALATAGDKDPAAALTRRLEADTGAIVELVDALDTPDQHHALSSLRRHSTRRSRRRPPRQCCAACSVALACRVP